MIRLFNTIIARIARSNRIAVTRRELEFMTDYELRDIGIARCDIESVARSTR